MPAITRQLMLFPHRGTRHDALRSLNAEINLENATLRARYRLNADMQRIRIVPPGEPGGRANGLWRHTCCEVFIALADTARYYELNFSPARQWAAYEFDSYRVGMQVLNIAAEPQITVKKSAHGLELEAVVPLNGSLAADAGRPRRIAVTAIVELEDGTLCYWSARHPQGKPDFHHPDGFVLELGT